MSSDANSMWSRWEEVDQLFNAALDRPRADRKSFVESACGEDSELRASVLHLLAIADSSDSRLEIPDTALAQGFVEELAGQAEIPDRIGRYSILRELGRGGMGTVFLAEYEGDDFRQQVALKVLRRGLDTADILARFVTERQILAKLKHPNIARLYDGGSTPGGRPYLVMEYVEGESIIDYCDRERLDVRQRLQLMLQVADAVNAAHTNLIVHRDLKPSNILVTTDRHVKLLDFGIAKILDPEDGADRTRTGSYLLTPDHASPEQLRGEPVTTATDVYQLGVLLFRLLTGRRPFRSANGSPLEPEELTKRAEIPKPSAAVSSTDEGMAVTALRSSNPKQLRRILRGDLDTIIGKALNAEASRRYSSSASLAEDIRRFLAGRPISARPESFGYQSRKFLHRHPWVLPVGLVAVAVLGMYMFTLVRYTTRLEAERNTAQLESARAEEVQRFLFDLFSSANPYMPADPNRGRRITVLEALDLGVERLEISLEDQTGARASILSTIAGVYKDLGAYDRALPLCLEALELQRSFYGPSSRPLRDSLGQLAEIRAGLGELEMATELHEQRLEISLGAAKRDDAEIADARTRLGRHLFDLNQSEAAEDQLRAAVALAEGGRVPPLTEVEACRSLADGLRLRSKFEEAEHWGRRAVELADTHFGAVSTPSALARATLATVFSGMGRSEAADKTFRSAIEDLERTLGTDHGYRLTTMNNYAVLKSTAGEFADAAKLLAQIVEIAERVYGADHPEVGDILQNYGTALARLDRLDEATPALEQAAQIFRDRVAADNFVRALPLLSLSEIHLTQSEASAAERTSREAITVLEQALPADHYVTAIARCRLARALVQQGQFTEAAPYFEGFLPPLLEATEYPDYRRTCLDSAAAFYVSRGADNLVAQIEAALASIDSETPIATAVSTD